MSELFVAASAHSQIRISEPMRPIHFTSTKSPRFFTNFLINCDYRVRVFDGGVASVIDVNSGVIHMVSLPTKKDGRKKFVQNAAKRFLFFIKSMSLLIFPLIALTQSKPLPLSHFPSIF